MASTFSIHLLPKSPPDPVTWSKLITLQKNFRLQSLQLSPESFSSTYEREVAFSDQDWEERLLNPSALAFVSIKHPDNGQTPVPVAEQLTTGEWVGSVVLFEPPSEQLGTGQDKEGSTKKSVLFDLFAVYVLPDARGAGIGAELVETAVAHGQTLAKDKGYEEVVVRASVAAGNAPVVKFYEKLGFVAEEEVEGENKGDGTVMMRRRCRLN